MRDLTVHLDIKAICWRLLPPQDIALTRRPCAAHYRARKAPQQSNEIRGAGWQDNECTHLPPINSGRWADGVLTCSAMHGQSCALMQIHVPVPSVNLDSYTVNPSHASPRALVMQAAL